MVPDLHRPRPRGATLAELAQELGATVMGDPATRVTDVHHDSRRVEAGDIFAARKGQLADGLRFVPQALTRGAVAVLAAHGHAPAPGVAPLLLVADVRVAMAKAAELLHGRPSRDLAVFGMTGTNGKTTTVWLLQHVLEAEGARPGVLGTFGARFGNVVLDTGFNTPEADELARIAAWMRDEGATHLLMEMTSIALDQRRTDGLRLRAAAFTNLTQDHLDYHVTMERYGAAKQRLFLELAPERPVVMVDDAFGRSLAQRLGSRAIRVSRHQEADADIRPAGAARHGMDGLRCVATTPWGAVELESALFGEHNLSNLLLALGSCVALGVDVRTAAQRLASCPPPPGRLERCDGPGDDVVAFVDYAHTPDGLQQVLASLRGVGTGRLVCVFGCGGERDATKRAPMGRMAERGSDIVVLTSDNPRSEQPGTIAEQVLSGVSDRSRVIVELDRARAIRLATDLARSGDVLLVAGKGHETTQVAGGRVSPFDDRQHVRAALADRRIAAERLYSLEPAK